LFRPLRQPLGPEMLLKPEILTGVFTPIVKLLALAAATITFVYTTPPYLYAPALGQIGLNYKAAYVVQLGLRYIPEFIEEMKRTLEAQMARGYKPKGGGNLIARIVALTPLVVPVTISATLSIYDIADAMELRGFGEVECHTWFRALKFRKADFVVVAISTILAAVYTIFFVIKP
ncbi:MAG: energy-coupling factor transporter transmembrane component T, partial [Thermofilaceae archaeon]